MKKNESLVILLFYFYLLSLSKCFLISVIMAIYNTGRYLDDSIGSLLNQTIGLSNIQIILVNDGSIDNSEQICLKYQKLYSKNII
jgi:glycosyltransferase involved in cell wall biosynthesis